MEEIAHTNGCNQHSQNRRGPQGLIGQPFDDDPQDRTDNHGQDDAHHSGELKAGSGIEADVRAHHDDIAVGKVQHLGDAVDHGIAQGDDGVNASQANPADQKTQKGHIGSLISFSFFIVSTWRMLQCGSESGRTRQPLSDPRCPLEDSRGGL